MQHSKLSLQELDYIHEPKGQMLIGFKMTGKEASRSRSRTPVRKKSPAPKVADEGYSFVQGIFVSREFHGL